jgi:hypothetical protein
MVYSNMEPTPYLYHVKIVLATIIQILALANVASADGNLVDHSEYKVHITARRGCELVRDVVLPIKSNSYGSSSYFRGVREHQGRKQGLVHTLLVVDCTKSDDLSGAREFTYIKSLPMAFVDLNGVRVHILVMDADSSVDITVDQVNLMPGASPSSELQQIATCSLFLKPALEEFWMDLPVEQR